MTIYFNRADFRADMRCPINSSRAHAVCRRLTGTAKQWPSPWYGAHYWAACSILSSDPSSDMMFEAFMREAVEFRGKSVRLALKLWRVAYRRVLAVRDEAMALGTSLEW